MTPAATPPDLTNLSGLSQNVGSLQNETSTYSSIPQEADRLFAMLQEGANKLTDEYQKKFASPLREHLHERCSAQQYLERQKISQFTLTAFEADAVQAVLLNGRVCLHSSYVPDHVFSRSTEAAQELADQLYNDFVNRQESNFPVKSSIPSLHIWGEKEIGPCSWPLSAFEKLKLNASVVSFPFVYVQGGLLAWTAYAQVVAGHNSLHAEICSHGELQNRVRIAFTNTEDVPQALSDYWVERINDIASDVLGILTLGPAAAIGLVVYLRGLSPTGKLRADGSSEDSHPSDLLRGLLAAKVIRQLKIDNAREWKQVLWKEVMKDYPSIDFTKEGGKFSVPGTIRLQDNIYFEYQVIESVDVVANSLLSTKLKCLGKKSFSELRCWNQHDMNKTDLLQGEMEGICQIEDIGEFRAAHAIAAATFSAMKAGVNVQGIFERMTGVLARMHEKNRHWGQHVD